jgi:hypothetical protein
MLTPEQYEAVGRITLAFNEIEFMVEAYLAHIIDSPEKNVSQFLAGSDQIFKKTQRFDKILKLIEKEYSALAKQVQIVRDLLRRALALAEERNGYVHALIVQDFGTRETKLRIRGKGEVACNVAELHRLAEEMTRLANELDIQCFLLSDWLAHERPDKKRPATPPVEWITSESNEEEDHYDPS